jgi:ketose-bisphosphate aldolase
MLAAFDDILPAPGSGRAPVAAFTCYGLEAAAGVLHAAERRDAPVMLLVSAQAYRSSVGRPLLSSLRAIADSASTPVALQLDHVSDLALMESALEQGVQAIMADGSKLPYRDNVDLVTEARTLAERYGAHVEAELGHIAGDEERSVGAASSGFTDPAEAAGFASETGATCLAVSIGNVHGKYASAPRLDIGLLREIEARTELPLSLHGASGLPSDQLASALGGAIAKINVNTELRERYLGVVADRLPDVTHTLDLLELGTSLVSGIADVAGAKLDELALMTNQGARN